MQHHGSPTKSSEHSHADELAAGTRVRLQGITSRPGLNGMQAVVEAWDAASKRYLVRLEDGDKIRIRPRCIDPAHRAPTPTPTPTRAPTRAPVDPTLFVQAGAFVQPGAPAAPEALETCAADAEALEHRLPLPAGHWDVQLVERDGQRLTVTLVATEKTLGSPDDPAEPPEHCAAWNELRGFRCTRSLFVVDDPTTDATVAVEGATLSVRVPHAHAEPMQRGEGSPVEMEIEAPLKDKLHYHPYAFSEDKENRVH